MFGPKISRRGFLASSAALAAAWTVSGRAAAQTLDQARAGGMVGEGLDGYLFPVQNTAEIVSLVQSVNDRRRAQYQALASRNNVRLSVVEQQAGAQLIQRAQPGWYIMTPSGPARR